MRRGRGGSGGHRLAPWLRMEPGMFDDDFLRRFHRRDIDMFDHCFLSPPPRSVGACVGRDDGVSVTMWMYLRERVSLCVGDEERSSRPTESRPNLPYLFEI